MSIWHQRHPKAHHLYVVSEAGVTSGPTKVGTATNVEYRIASLRDGNPRALTVVATFTFETHGVAVQFGKALLSRLTRVAPGRSWVAEGSAQVVEIIKSMIVERA
jgi:hypothetical protein